MGQNNEGKYTVKQLSTWQMNSVPILTLNYKPITQGSHILRFDDEVVIKVIAAYLAVLLSEPAWKSYRTK